MAASRIAKRKTIRPSAALSSPKLASIAPSEAWEQGKFEQRGKSILASLLTIGQSLPSFRYDRAILSEVGNFNVDDKARLLEDLESLNYTLDETLAQFGFLLAGQDKIAGCVGHEELVSIGFTIDGLASLSQEISEMRARIHEAKPQGRERA